MALDVLEANDHHHDITTLSSHVNFSQAEANLQPYLNEIHNWTLDNNLTLNADKSTSTLFTLDPSETDKQLNLTINNKIVPTVKYPKILGLTFDPRINFLQHTRNAIEKAKKGINILKALTSTGWGKQKETLVSTYNAITRPKLEYANSIWSPILASTNLQKLQVIQNNALRIATGCTKDTNTQHLHDETEVLPLKEHLKLHASQLKNKANHPKHPLNSLLNIIKPQSLSGTLSLQRIIQRVPANINNVYIS